MADQTSNVQEAGAKASHAENAADFVDMDFDELADNLDDEIDAQQNSSKDKSEVLAKSREIRRRIEEKLEVRLLRDELGIDDLGLD